jgi:hypothetical protein
MKLRASGTDVIGTTRSLAAGDPRNWVQYKFPDDSIKGSIEDERFDFVIVAARLARANTETDPSRGTEAFSFDELFDCPSSEFLGQRAASFKGGSGSSGWRC